MAEKNANTQTHTHFRIYISRDVFKKSNLSQIVGSSTKIWQKSEQQHSSGDVWTKAIVSLPTSTTGSFQVCLYLTFLLKSTHRLAYVYLW